MSTTSLKLPDDVKQLAAAAARQQGVTPHAFMVDAIRAAAEAAAKRAAFVADAAACRADALGSGKGYGASEVESYVKARARGKTAARPRARAWRS
ncbi:MAG: hypothetical protein JNM50_14680 [Chromatiales bacterium]|jgi:hypothetical protein|nr:hypothetical protein [Chromatiales bacterium]